MVDDHEIVSRGIISLLKESLGHINSYKASNYAEGLSLATKFDIQLAIIDIMIPGRNGLELVKDIHATKPDIPIIVVSAHSELDYGLRALKAGASGYVSKQVAPVSIITAVKRVLEGGRYVSPTLAEHLAATLANPDRQSIDKLSNREIQVLKLIATGMTIKQIGAELNLSDKTVATYRSRISEKLHLSTNVDLTRYALRNGIVT